MTWPQVINAALNTAQAIALAWIGAVYYRGRNGGGNGH